MSINLQTYIDDLFKGYDETAELRDFKEEITSNLFERMNDLIKNGLNEKEAFTKAINELGDITTIANEISKQKRNEVIGEMYIQQELKVDWKHALGYVLAGGILLFGIISALMTYLTTSEISHGLSTLLPFLVISGTAFVFLGLTQETRRNYSMSWIRALIYAIATGLFLFGVNIFVSQFFIKNTPWNGILGVFIPFVLPALGIIGFLLLTEKSRNKPWIVKEQQIMLHHHSQKFSDPETMTKRGLLSGALWIFTFGIFAFVWIIWSIKFAWIVFIFAIVMEMFIELWFQTKHVKR
ncbi:permease prefix domain 1-containing protein [Caldibacillus lycopersici]|uniref:Permease prefix domain 1-containing protein n=1 Tax=Perspicuibacillus lycopersici TaxID=1325689 RepID=A0AAE3LLI1_9BACI|nr:permease prefix domain 1-containing protein [Perspicuibacillus lycopersici]MCU9612370.1 permease prefix domain 1-containing protein [Perspicuibacillus lycopersici]